MISEQGLHSITFGDSQRESLEKMYKEREDSPSDDIRDLRRQMDRQKSANTKRVGEVQTLSSSFLHRIASIAVSHFLFSLLSHLFLGLMLPQLPAFCFPLIPLQIMVKTVGLGSGNFGQPKSGFLINVHFHIPFQKAFLQYQRSLENLPSSHLLTSFSVF